MTITANPSVVFQNTTDAEPEDTPMWEVECAGSVQVAEPITYTRAATTFTYVTSFYYIEHRSLACIGSE